MNRIKFLQSAIIEKEKLYFIVGDLGALCSINLDNWKVQYITQLSIDSIFWSLHSCNELFYCCSLDDGSITIYNKKTSEQERKRPDMKVSASKAFEVFEYKDRMIFMPRVIPNSVYEFSVRDKKYYRRNTICNSIFGTVFRWNRYRDTIFIITVTGDKLIEYNMETGIYTYMNNPLSEKIFDAVLLNGMYYLLTEKNDGKIYVFEPYNNSLYEIEVEKGLQYKKIFTDGARLFLDAGVRIDIIEDNVLLKKGAFFFEQDIKGANFICTKEYGDSIVFLPWQREEFAIINLTNYYAFHAHAKLSVEDLIKNRYIIYENSQGLSNFMEYIRFNYF